MAGKLLRINLSHMATAFCLTCLIVCSGSLALAESKTSHVVCRPDFSASRRTELAGQLRTITGWPNLDFDDEGALRLGSITETVGGSPSARELLSTAAAGPNVLVFEDASNRSDVVFARVVEGRWTQNPQSKPPVFLILIDFTDFSRVIGDKPALAAFNEGWAVLHEIAHVVHNSVDPDRGDVMGECESLVNRMRRECGLAERAQYSFDFFPGPERTEFTTKYVRLAFELEIPETNSKKRYWIVWDANLAGGLETSRQVAFR